MGLFHIIEDAVAILRSKGVFKQVKLFARGKDVYAQWGGGFIKLHGRSGTSLPNVSWEEIEATGVDFSRAGSQPTVIGAE